MTDRQRLALAVAEARRELRALALDGDATRDAIEAATAKLDTLEVRAAALTASEPTPAPSPAPSGAPDGEDAEGREFRALECRVQVGRYVGAALAGQGVDGAEAEFNQALKMGATAFPLRTLAPAEVRATTDADGAAAQQGWIDRLFGDSVARWLGVQMPSVPAGASVWPVTTGGPTGAQRGRTEDAADGAWTVGVTEVKPTRNSVRVVFSIADAARLPGIEDALRRDLGMALTDGLDKAVLVGDAGANEDRADITGLNTAANVTEQTLGQGAKATAASVLAAFVNMVDGKHAAMLSDVRAALSVAAYKLWSGTVATSAENDTLIRFLADSGLPAIRVREGISTVTTAGAFGAFAGLQRGIEGAGVAPVWEAAHLIRDPYSDAAGGQVAVTLSALWGFALPRASNFARLKFVA